MTFKRALYWLHRWFGIVLCTICALWFASGIVMMYVDFPQLTPPERLAGLPTLDFSAAQLAPGAAVERLRAGDFATVGTPHRNRAAEVADPSAPIADVTSVRLGMLLDVPVYYVQAAGGAQPRAVRADTGEVVAPVGEAQARAVAIDFAQRTGLDATALRYLGHIQTDQWTVSAALNAHRPLHRFAVGDEAGTELYVSSTTGELVRDSHRTERWLNYAGAVSHWLYPTFIRRHAEGWATMVEVVSGAGVLLAISGLWIGLQRWRFRAGAGVSGSPYRGFMRWHHITGLLFGIVALTWVFSGLLSMNPADLNPSRTPTAAERQVYSGTALRPADFELLGAAPSARAVDAELLHYDGAPYYLLTSRDGAARMVPAGRAASAPPSAAAVLERAPRLLPGAPLANARVLESYDDYWYTRRPENGGRILPVVRIQFADASRTWFYVDPATGRVLERSTRLNRAYRWLYNGLHSWDIRWLWERRPLWDIAVIAFSLGGLALSITGVVTGVRYFRMEAKRSRQRREQLTRKHAEVSGSVA